MTFLSEMHGESTLQRVYIDEFLIFVYGRVAIVLNVPARVVWEDSGKHVIPLSNLQLTIKMNFPNTNKSI